MPGRDHRTAAAVLAVAVVAVVAVAAGVGVVGVWTDADPADNGTTVPPGATPVGSCTTITEPGRYALAADLTNVTADTCIAVRSSDVTFDGRGHAVDGTGAFGSAGVLVAGEGRLSNVTVRDVRVTDWDDGVRFVGVDDGAMRGVTVARTRVGLTLLNSNRNRIADSVALRNRLYGVSVVDASAGNRLVNVTARDNVLFGVHLVEPGVANNTLEDSVASNNEFGVVLIGARDNRVENVTATGNRIAGVWLSAADGNVVADSSVSNRFYGVFLADDSTRNRVVDTVADGNAVGVRLRSSDRNRVAANLVTDSSDTGILLIQSDGVVVVDNVGSDNRRGVSLVGSENVTLRNNSL